jgi:hypothetical protein
MVEAVRTPSIVIDLIGDLDLRLGEMAAQTLARLEIDRPIIISLKNIVTVHIDGFNALVRAIKARTDFGRPTSIVSNGKKTDSMFDAVMLGDCVVSWRRLANEPTSRRLLLARHSEAASRRR